MSVFDMYKKVSKNIKYSRESKENEKKMKTFYKVNEKAKLYKEDKDAYYEKYPVVKDEEKINISQKREGYPHPVDPEALRLESDLNKQRKARLTGAEVQDKIKTKKQAYKERLKAIDPWQREQNQQKIQERFTQDPNSVSRQELVFMLDKTPEMPDVDYETTEQWQERSNKKSRLELLDKQIQINQAQRKEDPSDKNRYKFSAAVRKSDFKQNEKTKNDLVIDKDIDKWTEKDRKKLLDSKKENVMVRWDGKWMRMTKEDAEKYSERSFSGSITRQKMNFDEKNLLDFATDKAADDWKGVMAALDSVPQSVKGGYKNFKKETDAELLKLSKPALDGGMYAAQNFAFPVLSNLYKLSKGKNSNESEKQTAQKFKESLRGSAEEAKDIWANRGKYDAGTIAKTTLQGAGGGFKKSWNGDFARNPEESLNFYDFLTEEGYDKEAASTKALGFGLDVASGIVPNVASVSPRVVATSGKITAKNMPKAMTAIEKMVESRTGMTSVDIAKGETPQARSIAKIMDQIRTNKEITPQQIDEIQAASKADEVERITSERVMGSKNNSAEIGGRLWDLEDRKKALSPQQFIRQPDNHQLRAKELERAFKEMDYQKQFSVTPAKQQKMDELTGKIKETENVAELDRRVNQMKYARETGDYNKTFDLDSQSQKRIANLDERLKNTRFQAEQSAISRAVQNRLKTDQSIQGLDKNLEVLDHVAQNKNALSIRSAMDRYARESGRLDDDIAKTTDQLNQRMAFEDLVKQAVGNRYDKKNAYKDQFIKDGFLGPVKTDPYLRLFGMDVKGSDKVLSGLSKAMKAATPSFVADNFIANYGVDRNIEDLQFEQIGKQNIQKAASEEKLAELFKGMSKTDRDNLAFHLVDPDNKMQHNKTLSESALQRLGDFRQYSDDTFARDVQYNPKIEKRDNYLTGMYKNNEKALTKIFGDEYMKRKANPAKYFNEEKAYDNFLEAAQKNKKLKPVTDAQTLLAKREFDSIDNANRLDFKANLEQLREMNPKMFNERTEKYIDRYINPQNYVRTPTGAVGKAWQGYNDWWKTVLLSTFSDSAARDLMGGAANNLLKGGNPQDLLEAATSKSGTRLKDGTFIDGETLNRMFGEANIGKDISRVDVNNPDAIRGQKGWRALNPFDKDNFILLEPGKRLRNAADTTNRKAMYLNKLNEYGQYGGREAARAVRDTQFDYSQHSLTDTEQFIKRNLIPFYSFLRFNAPLHAKSMATQPARYNVVANQIPDAFNEQNGEDPRQGNQFLSKFEEDYLHAGDGKYFSQAFNPVLDARETFTNPVEKAASSANPLLKVLYDSVSSDPESLGGWNIEGNRAAPVPESAGNFLMDQANPVAQALGMHYNKDKELMMDAEALQSIQNVLPKSNAFANIFKAYNEKQGSTADRAKETALSPVGANLLFGLGHKTINPSSEYFTREADLRRTNEELQQRQAYDEVRPGYIDKEYKFEDPVPDFATDFFIENAYMENKKMFEEARHRAEDLGQLENPYRKRDSYGNYTVHDIFGNPVEFIPRYKTATTAGVQAAYDKAYAEAEAGRAKSAEMMEWYQQYQEKPPTMEEAYELEGRNYPYRNLYQRSLEPWEREALVVSVPTKKKKRSVLYRDAVQ